MESELKHYGVQDPDWTDSSYINLKDEYLCLWEVTPDEVVGEWDSDALDGDDNWYENTILPAFKEHNDRFLRKSRTEETFDMSTVKNALPRMLPGSVDGDALFELDRTIQAHRTNFPMRIKSSSEEENGQFEDDDYWDRDEEADEFNAIDDGYKILEGW